MRGDKFFDPKFLPPIPHKRYRVLGGLEGEGFLVGRHVEVVELSLLQPNPGYWKGKFLLLSSRRVISAEGLMLGPTTLRVCRCDRLPFPHKRNQECKDAETP